MMSAFLESLRDVVGSARTFTYGGVVTDIVGLLIESAGPKMQMGEICSLAPESSAPILGEAVGFRNGRVLIMPYGDLDGIAPGCMVVAHGRALQAPVGEGMLGRVVGSTGFPIDRKPMWRVDKYSPTMERPPAPLDRRRIELPLATGVRSIDGLLTLGEGQRIGIFSGSGVGKSTLMGMIARNTSGEVNVIALIGERGREVKEFIDEDLGEEGLSRSVVVVATSDEPALLRIKAAYVATAIAEYFRDQGKSVLLMMDSITRWCMALREIGLAIGEPPTTRGYTPSVFASLPKLLERAGKSDVGSITGIYTVLVEGDDMDEPIADATRGILDGHLVLSRQLAEMGHYPAVDVLASISRLMTTVAKDDHLSVSQKARSILATYRRAEDLVNIGAYVRGSNPEIDQALDRIGEINDFLQQQVSERSSFEETVVHLTSLFEESDCDDKEGGGGP